LEEAQSGEPFLRDLSYRPDQGGEKRARGTADLLHQGRNDHRICWLATMHKLFDKQLKLATRLSGEVDLAVLTELVCAAYEEADRDRRRTDRSISRMIEELDGYLRERERTAELLRKQKIKLDAALNNMSQGLCMFDAGARLVLCNQRYCEIMNLPAEYAVPGRTVQEIIAYRRASGLVPGNPDQVAADLLAAIAEGKTVRHVVKTDHGREVRIINEPMAGGGWVATYEDITDQRLAERERDRNQAFLNAVINAVPTTIYVKNAHDRKYVLINRAGEKYLGVRRERIIGKTARELFSGRLGELIEERDRRFLESGEELFCEETAVDIPGVGTRVATAIRVPIVDDKGRLQFMVGVIDDVTDRRRAEAAERHNAQMLTATITSMGDAVLVTGEDGQVIVANPAAKVLFGDRADVGSEDWARTYQLFLPDGVTPFPAAETPIAHAIRGESVDNLEIVLRTPGSAKTVHLVANGRPLRDPGGALKGAVIVYRDVTEAKNTERQLRQAQKMDAIGQLTGGIAHDFNNILTVITGTIEILAESVADRPQSAAIARMIDQAAERGAELTRHLLAVARKQPLRPRETDINTLIVETTALLRASLGEHVEIESMLEDDAWPALVDASQLTTALLNLAVNARDAMANGGKLTLETGNVLLDESYARMQGEVRPGPYVMIAVRDNGSGIPAAIRDKVFEPFFTTKGPGKGTGLGLSMVYGFVKQSGGHLRIHSEEGHGTTIKLYLPRAPAQAAEAAAVAPATAVGGQETVLIVEDDALVRKYVTAQLQSLGYRTLQAGNAAEALALTESGVDFDLLFTDIIMPGSMNGRQLAHEVARRRANLRVLFTSGYTENAFPDHGRLPPGLLLLAKPYRKSELARMLRQALETRACLSAA
jgi:PAS domain S-box-containing protein